MAIRSRNFSVIDRTPITGISEIIVVINLQFHISTEERTRKFPFTYCVYLKHRKTENTTIPQEATKRRDFSLLMVRTKTTFPQSRQSRNEGTCFQNHLNTL